MDAKVWFREPCTFVLKSISLYLFVLLYSLSVHFECNAIFVVYFLTVCTRFFTELSPHQISPQEVCVDAVFPVVSFSGLFSRAFLVLHW